MTDKRQGPNAVRLGHGSKKGKLPCLRRGILVALPLGTGGIPRRCRLIRTSYVHGRAFSDAQFTLSQLGGQYSAVCIYSKHL